MQGIFFSPITIVKYITLFDNLYSNIIGKRRDEVLRCAYIEGYSLFTSKLFSLAYQAFQHISLLAFQHISLLSLLLLSSINTTYTTVI